MDALNPPYIYTTLPNSKTHYELWKNYKQDSEGLFLTDVPKDLILFVDDSHIAEYITAYFAIGFFYNDTQVIRYSTPQWQHEFENYLKYAWITNDLLSGKIRYPVGAHWNPRFEKVILHPGNSRNVVYKLFAKNTVKAVYFNTGGLLPDWLTSKQTTLEYLKIRYTPNIDFVLTADHGTLIPHVHFDQSAIDGHIIQYHRIMKRYLTGKTIYSNFDLIEPLTKIPFLSTNKYSDIRILFKSAPSVADQLKAFLLISVPMLKIEHDNIVIEKDAIYR